MSKIHGMMDMGKRSMMNSQTALQTVGHNIANKSTEGYSRQRVDLTTAEPIGIGNSRVGMGAKTSGVSRVNNSYLERQIGKEQSSLGYQQGRADTLGRVEQIYNEQINKGLNQFVGEFFNAFRDFSNNPESMASRTLVKETSDAVVHDFQRVNKQLREIQNDVDFQVKSSIEEVNGFSRQIADLNDKIQQVEATGATANDERDRRDLMIKKLGEKIDIRWAEGADGMVTVTAGNSALLVAGHESKEMYVRSTPATDYKREGNADIFYKSKESGTPVVVTQQFKGGVIGAALEVRDQVVNGLLDDLDRMAYTLGKEVNHAHQQGFDRYNQKGEDFFDLGESPHGLAERFSVSQSILNDVGRIAGAGRPNAPGDNTVANVISSIQYKPVMEDGVTTIDDFYNGVVGRLGVMAKRANTSQEAQKDIVSQLNNIRESISGVSLDEETAKMIEFQKGFDASARLIRTADELFDTVLNLKRI
jgi:flagellar hook-associated protein 1 FlgK